MKKIQNSNGGNAVEPEITTETSGNMERGESAGTKRPADEATSLLPSIEDPTNQRWMNSLGYALWQDTLLSSMCNQHRNPLRTAAGHWYVASRREGEIAIEFLEDLKKSIEPDGAVPAALRLSTEKRFGAEFADLLEFNRSPRNPSLINLVSSFNEPWEDGILPSKKGAPDGDEWFALDPQRCRQVVLNLIDLHVQFLKDLIPREGGEV